MKQTMFFIQLDSAENKFLNEGDWVGRSSARPYTLTEATKEASKLRSAGTHCSLVFAS